MKKNIVVVGSGISGIFSAIYAQLKHSDSQVHLVEKSNKFGGLIQSFDYAEGRFDYGIHTFYETLDKEIDDIIINPNYDGGWKDLPGDWGGVYWNEQLNLDSPYLNLKNLKPAEHSFYLGEIIQRLNLPSPVGTQSAEHWLNVYFGESFTQNILKPIIEKIYRTELESLDISALRLLPLNRVIGFDLETTLNLMNSDFFRRKLAIPDQRKLPSQLASNRRGFYPNKMGLTDYTQSLIDYLHQIGGKAYSQTTVKNFIYSDKKIQSLDISSETSNETIHLQNIKRVIWAAGLPNFYFHENYPEPKNLAFDKPLNTLVCNMYIQNHLDIKDAQYIYVYDADFLTFRIAIYTNFSKPHESDMANVLKLSLEVLAENAELDNLDDKIEYELKKIGLIKNTSDILFKKYEKLPGGIPKLTRKNIDALESIRKAASNHITNLDFVGVGARNDFYFQADLLKDAKEKILAYV